MMLNKSLVYLTKRSVINYLSKLKRRPLKTIGILLVTIYYLYLPFFMKELFVSLNLNNRAGFVLITSIGTLYLIMPVTLTYFKRKGVTFRQQDINFILASPTPPKQALIYALSKEFFVSFVMQTVFLIAAIYIFDVPILVSLIYIFVNILFSNLTSYSLAIIMYAGEDLTGKQKQFIKRAVYLILAAVTLFLLTMVISQSIEKGFDFSYLISVVSSPFVLMIPIFGWQLGWLNLMLLGATPITLLTSGLFFASTIYLTYYAYQMVSTGEYYEDALSFSENLLRLEKKKGDFSFAEALGNKQKKYEYQGKLKGSKASVIFRKQLIERRRKRKYFFSLGDLLYLIAGIGIGVASIMIDDFINPDYFFEMMVGISIYLSIFFKPAAGWKSEFKNYYLFVMPDSSMSKLFYASLLENLLSFIRTVFLTIPAGILMRASFLDMIYAIIVQSLLKAMVTYVSILIEEIIGAKIGKTIASFINIVVMMITMIVPVLALLFITSISTYYSFLTISSYSFLIMLLFLFLSSANLDNIESLED